MISAKDVQNNKITFDNPRFISEDEFEIENKRTQIEADDVLLTIVATIGRTAVVPKTFKPFTLQRSVAVITTLINPNFLCYFFQSIFFQNQLTNSAKGTAQKGVYLKTLSELEVIVSPLAEQERIVAKIEELFSELDTGIESLKTAAQQLKNYRQAVLQWAFEGKLTNENVNEGELPSGWKWEKIGTVCKTIDGDRGKNYPKKNEFSDEGYCLFLSTKNVRDGRFVFEENIFITKEKDEILRGGKLKLNDVVITTRGTLGNVALYDEKIPYKHIRINSGMLILRIQNRNLKNIYLMNFITSPVFTSQLKEKQTGTAQPQIPANILREIEIPFGSIEEQQLIVEEIESRLSICDKFEETINQSLVQAESLRQSILKQAFEGKLVSQAESDEPASVLLKKIKEVREAFLQAEKEIKKQTTKKIKSKNMAEELKSILQLLKEKDEPIDTHSLWQSSEHKDDIDAFYATVKELIDKGEIEETDRKGKDSFLTLAASK